MKDDRTVWIIRPENRGLEAAIECDGKDGAKTRRKEMNARGSVQWVAEKTTRSELKRAKESKSAV